MSPRSPQEDLFPWEEPEEPRSEPVGESAEGARPERGRTKRATSRTVADPRSETADRVEPTRAGNERSEQIRPGRPERGDPEPDQTPPPRSPSSDALDAQLAAAAAILDRLGDATKLEQRPQARGRRRAVARKEYFSISDVCELVGLKPHVLRYWETQFTLLNPSKNRSGNRVYQRKEIKLVMLVKHLLYDEKYTIEGAKAKMEKLRRGGKLGSGRDEALDIQSLNLLAAELEQLERILRPPEPT